MAMCRLKSLLTVSLHTVSLLFGLCSNIRRVRLKAALHRMVSVWHQSTAREIREQMKPMLSNGSRGTLISYTDHSVQRRFKSNAPTDWISQHCWCSRAARQFELWSQRINGPCGAIQMSRVVSFRFWRINIILNIYQTLHIVLEENYIAIIIVIELSPSPTSKRLLRALIPLVLVIDRYWFFYNRYRYLYVYVTDNRYSEPIFIYCYKVNK